MYYPYQYQNPNSIIWVRGEQEAAAYPVAPNNALALWDSESPSIYLKQADATGRTTIRAYSLIEREEEKPEDPVTRSDMAEIMAAITALKAELKEMKEKEDE